RRTTPDRVGGAHVGEPETHAVRRAFGDGRQDAAAVALGAVPVAALGFANGGFYPRAWGWATVGLAIVVVGAAIVVPWSPSRRPLALLTLVAGLGSWIALSVLWTHSASVTVPEVQRGLLYVTGLEAAALFVRPARWRSLAFGVMCGLSVVVIWGLASYLST